MSEKTLLIDNAIPFWLVIPAAGSGKRMGDTALPKQYQPLAGKAVLQHTLDAFLPIKNLQGIVVAINVSDQDFAGLAAAKNSLIKTVIGGAERSDSVSNALEYLSGKAKPGDWVLVHDAARPLIQAQDVVAMLKSLATSDVGGIMAIPVSDTVKVVSDNSKIASTEDRSRLWQAQTPQMFRLSLLCNALQHASKNNIVVTDEASALEQLGYKPLVYQGKRSNIKITVPDDWVVAEALLRGSAMNHSMGNPRVGHGFDVHRFASEGDHIVLGGVTIPHHKKLIAHSDGDVLIHALCDALLGAAALGDIGKHFPDTDNKYKNIDSRQLLRHVVSLLKEKKFEIGNVDVTVVAQAPKVQPHVSMMRENLARDLNVDIDVVNVKATTTEKLGFEGREEGISCHAIALLHKK